MLDKDGYRPNVGIILVNGRNEVFWGKRIREHSWQFPQGGIKHGESIGHMIVQRVGCCLGRPIRLPVPAGIEATNYLGNSFLFQSTWHDPGVYIDRSLFVFGVT